MTYYERKKKMRKLEIKENIWKWILETVIILFVLFICIFGYANSEGGMRGRRGRTVPLKTITEAINPAPTEKITEVIDPDPLYPKVTPIKGTTD